MKIKWKYLCHMCLAPLDPYYKDGVGWEYNLFDQYLAYTDLPFELNNGYTVRNIRVCKCCYLNGPIKYNPRIDALRQVGAIKFDRPRTRSITHAELTKWVADFYQVLEDNKPK